jgi:RHS repeat-associated protein
MMKYDYMNRRVEVALEEFEEDTWTAVWTRRYLYDGWHLIAEIDPDGYGLPVTSTYFWGYDVSNSIGGAGGIGGLLLIDDDTNRYLPGYDVQGNVILLVKESDGSLAAQLEYGPYGEVIRMQGAYDKTPFRWQTKWDLDYMCTDVTGFSWGVLDYGLRWYQPKHGRFINRDPIGEAGGLNLYEAFGGDPVNRWDYLGLDLMWRDMDIMPWPRRPPWPPPWPLPPWGKSPWEYPWSFSSSSSGANSTKGKNSFNNPFNLEPFIVNATPYNRSSISVGSIIPTDLFLSQFGILLHGGKGAGLSFTDGFRMSFKEDGGEVIVTDRIYDPNDQRDSKPDDSPKATLQGPTITQMERMMSDSINRPSADPFAFGNIHNKFPDDIPTILAASFPAIIGSIWVAGETVGVIASQLNVTQIERTKFYTIKLVEFTFHMIVETHYHGPYILPDNSREPIPEKVDDTSEKGSINPLP